jgi:hypothetical protein
VPLHDDDPIACSQPRVQQFTRWLEQLRAGDATFAEASALYPDDMNEWQSAVYLLTGFPPVWSATRHDVLSEVSIAPVSVELDHPRRAWSASEQAVMRWAVHFWHVYITEIEFPWICEQSDFARWVTACHLHRRYATSFTPGGGQR